MDADLLIVLLIAAVVAGPWIWALFAYRRERRAAARLERRIRRSV